MQQVFNTEHYLRDFERSRVDAQPQVAEIIEKAKKLSQIAVLARDLQYI